MTRPRLRIGQAMMLVVLLAGDCVLARELILFRGPSGWTGKGDIVRRAKV